MARIGAFDRHLEPLAWWEVELLPAGWYVDELLVEPAAGGVTGTVTSTLSDATLSATGTVVTPSTSSAILITSSNNPSYRSGFYSPRRGGTPKYPSLWDGCVGAWAPSLGATGGRLFDHSFLGTHGTLTNMDLASDWIASDGKLALDFDGTNDHINCNGTFGGLTIEGSKTVSLWAKPTTLVNRQNIFHFAVNDSAGANSSWQIERVNTTQVSLTQWGGSQLVFENMSNNVWSHLLFQQTGTTIRIFVNGINTNSGTVGQTGNITTCRIGSMNAAYPDPYYSGSIDDVRIYNRALSAKEIRTLALRRGIAFESKRRLAVRSGAASPSGTVVRTLDDATLSATGTLTNAATGSLSSTLANATLSATGTVAAGASGSVARTLDAATLSSSGTIGSGLTGSVSVSLSAATLSSSGTLTAGASGSVTRTLDAVTLSSSGTIGSGLTGSVSASLGAATLVSSGTLTAGASGTVTRTLDNTTLSSSGTVAAGASGTVSRTLDNVTLSSTGGAAGSVTGSVSSTLAAVTCSSSGTLAAGLSGSVTRTLDAVTSSATGTLTNGASGTVTRTLANATLASGGSLSAGLTAQVNRALDSCVVSSSGTLSAGATGTLSVQLASATLQSGNVAVGGLRIKVGSEWKNANAFVKVTGTWRTATPYVKVSGVWKQ